MSFTYISLFCALAVCIGVVSAGESHTIKFVNNCGTGAPTLVQGGKILNTGDEFTSQGSLQSAIAYLNTDCLLNGEKCTTLEMNLNNPTCAGCGPSVDLSLINPHAFNVATSFEFYGGSSNEFGTAGSCDGLGAICSEEGCDTAFHNPNDNQVQRACQLDNINLLVTFCNAGSTGFTPAVPNSLANIGSQSNSGASAQPKPEATTSSPSPEASSSSAAAAAPSAVRPIAPIATAPAPASSSTAAALSTASNPPSRSNTQMCSGKRRRRSASSNVIGMHKRFGSKAHAHLQERAQYWRELDTAQA